MSQPAAPTHRLAFLIVESEPHEGLSTRKLLIETAKHNVLTAYSAQEGIHMLSRFPEVDAVVFDMDVSDMACENFVTAVRKLRPQIKAIALASSDGLAVRGSRCADFVISSHQPAELLDILEKEFGVSPS